MNFLRTFFAFNLYSNKLFNPSLLLRYFNVLNQTSKVNKIDLNCTYSPLLTDYFRGNFQLCNLLTHLHQAMFSYHFVF